MLGKLSPRLRRPSRTMPAGALPAPGGIGGVMLCGGFDTALDHTRRVEFRIACHEMRDKAHAGYTRTIHDSKPSRGTRIDCRNGIAHGLPDLTAGYRTTFRAPRARGAEDVDLGGGPHGPGGGRGDAEKVSPGQGQGRQPRHGEASADGRLLPGTVVERRDGRLEVRIGDWQQAQAFRVVHQRMGQRSFAAGLQPARVDRVERGAAVEDPVSDLARYPARLEGRTGHEDLSAGEAGVRAGGAERFPASCTTCHAERAAQSHLADPWIGTLEAMARFISLEKDEPALLQTRLQRDAKDGGDHVGGS